MSTDNPFFSAHTNHNRLRTAVLLLLFSFETNAIHCHFGRFSLPDGPSLEIWAQPALWGHPMMLVHTL